MSGRGIDTSHGPFSININPRFSKRLDGMVADLALIALQIQGPLQEAQDILAELNDYLGFEIEKTELRRTRGEQHGDLAEVEGAELWLSNLRTLAEVFPSRAATSSHTVVMEAIEAIELGLQGKEADHSEE